MLLDSIHNLFSALVRNVLTLMFYYLFTESLIIRICLTQRQHAAILICLWAGFTALSRAADSPLSPSTDWNQRLKKKLLALLLKFSPHQKWAELSEGWSQNIYFQLAMRSKTHWNEPFIPSLVILFSNRAAEFMGNSLGGYLRSRKVTEKKGIRPRKNVFTVRWNITNLVKCHLEWKSKHILIRLFKVEGPRLRLWERGGQLIAVFDVMFGICLHFDVTAWKPACSLLYCPPTSHTPLNEMPQKGPGVVGTILFSQRGLLHTEPITEKGSLLLNTLNPPPSL